MKTSIASPFEAIYANEQKLKEFLKAMGGIQMGNFMMFSKLFDFSNYKTHCDVGGAGGYLVAHIALNNTYMNCITFDLPPVTPVAKENVVMMGISDRVSVHSGDFLIEDLPKADVITMGNILHD